MDEQILNELIAAAVLVVLHQKLSLENISDTEKANKHFSLLLSSIDIMDSLIQKDEKLKELYEKCRLEIREWEAHT